MLIQRDSGLNENRDEHIDMTPMVDVVFQLMTFMLFSIQMTGGEEVDLPVAKHGIGVEENIATVVTVREPAKPGESPILALRKDKGEEVAVSLDQVRQEVAGGLAKGRRKVILQADGDLPHGEIMKVAATISELDGVTLHIGVQEPQ